MPQTCWAGAGTFEGKLMMVCVNNIGFSVNTKLYVLIFFYDCDRQYKMCHIVKLAMEL